MAYKPQFEGTTEEERSAMKGKGKSPQDPQSVTLNMHMLYQVIKFTHPDELKALVSKDTTNRKDGSKWQDASKAFFKGLPTDEKNKVIQMVLDWTKHGLPLEVQIQ